MCAHRCSAIAHHLYDAVKTHSGSMLANSSPSRRTRSSNRSTEAQQQDPDGPCHDGRCNRFARGVRLHRAQTQSCRPPRAPTDRQGPGPDGSAGSDRGGRSRVRTALWLAGDALLPSRIQMAFTLATHVLLVPLGVAFPTLTLAMEGIGLFRKDPVALKIARRWSVVMAVQFAVGAVTGTILSFEFGILWPRLMGRFGPALGLGVAIEGLASRPYSSASTSTDGGGSALGPTSCSGSRCRPWACWARLRCSPPTPS